MQVSAAANEENVSLAASMLRPSAASAAGSIVGQSGQAPPPQQQGLDAGVFGVGSQAPQMQTFFGAGKLAHSLP